MTAEEWRSVPGFPDYLVSDLGRVASTKRWRGSDFRYLTPQPHSINGYPYVQMFPREGRKVCRSVHGLVAAAFLGPRPDGMEVCHGDGDPGNCQLSNLRYDTHAANEQDKRLHGTYPGGQVSCIHGHEFTPENTRTYGNHRFCIECDRRRGREYRARRAFRAANVPLAS